jgi:hypothetical protein
MTPQELTPYLSRLVDQNLPLSLMLWWTTDDRKSDRAAVFEMASALAIRFIYLDFSLDFDSFMAWGLRCGLNEQVWAFLAFLPGLLHQIDAQLPAWPSPRSWAMADRLRGAALAYNALGLMLPEGDKRAIAKAAKSKDWLERAAATYAPGIQPSLLKVLLEDPAEAVRQCAVARLRVAGA